MTSLSSQLRGSSMLRMVARQALLLPSCCLCLGCTCTHNKSDVYHKHEHSPWFCLPPAARPLRWLPTTPPPRITNNHRMRPSMNHATVTLSPCSEAVEVAAHDPAAKYALGSVLNHVLLHQTVIGEEALEQL